MNERTSLDSAETPIVPLVSSSVTGPLGVMHLPRLWLKLLLHATGRLPDGYRHGAGGFDEALCRNLGIDCDALIAYIENERPRYTDVERWVRSHATTLDSEHIAAHNRYVLEHAMPAELLDRRLHELGIPDCGITDAVTLNDLDDWSALHRQLQGT